VLFEPFAGILHKSLIDTGIVSNFAKLCGPERLGAVSLFHMGFEGVNASIEEVRKVIDLEL